MTISEGLQAETVCTDESRTSKPIEGNRAGLSWQWRVVAFCAAVAIIISRQPDAMFHAQFVAEDGVEWFANAYNHGWFGPLLWPHSGYLQTLPRLAAGLALLVPVKSAPLVMNLVGLVIQALPVPLLLSGRFSKWGSLRFRSALAISYLVMPNCSEINVTVTEAQWHLSLLACLLVVANTPSNNLERWVDAVILILCGLTGPFSIFLLPISCAMLYWTQERKRWLPVVILACAATMEGISLFFHAANSRSHLPLGASLGSLSKLLAGQVYLATLVGHNTLALQLDARTLACISAIATVVVIWAFVRSPIEVRLFAVFSAMILFASLRSPGLPEHLTPLEKTLTGWRIMAGAVGVRYWFFPTLLCTWMIVTLLTGPKRNKATELLGGALTCLMLYGVIRDFRHPANKDLCFAQYAEKLAHSQTGDEVVIPENPNPQEWTVRLKKR
ncbi:MAG: hypothetical protein JOY54_13415 [Acidobacteriaceae bacterium]|nr:hypothetical protein [Acidobacteriaceae bacterium]